MRMWMIDPMLMCNKHLLGEHVEHHMFVGYINKGIRLDGYVNNNLFEPTSLMKRHNDLVMEMNKRNMNHKSPLPEFKITKHLDSFVDKEKSFKDLISRCQECKNIAIRCNKYGR